MATELEAARWLVFHAAWNLDYASANPLPVSPSQETNSGPLVLSSSMAKLYATEVAQRVVDRALQIHGGYGLLKGTAVERLYLEVRALRIYEGTTEIQKEIIAHHLLKAEPAAPKPVSSTTAPA